ncbi:MAG: UDP-N-acetylmuramate--L-alanine ligase [Candidatus Sungbacteria bacterium]|uniref:UDP-N-acetylmuramate--L-alanine ligase n=1 Tax=Candidatus Sungiibacteriota bacterium TaxID=2750080 RepID=A0A932YYS6_9BACT|nr:UDP-N-acetylmuramate--L-alanine ligase [Candidatus Sungbacteria bacterium]
MNGMQPAHAHFIGIGGIGMSALARLYLARGWRVSGSDLARSEITDALRKEGIRVFIGHRRLNIAPAVTKIIRTIAVPKDNPELLQAKRRRIPSYSYAEAVGELSRKYKTIAVAGAHGKSTTTALISLMLIKAGLDPTIIIGAKLRELGNSNFRSGKSKFLVLEADEYRASFLHYHPEIAVITNIDREHLDFYKNAKNIEAAFLKFLTHVRRGGLAVLNRDDPRVRGTAARLRRAKPDIRIAWFSLESPLAQRIKRILKIPGKHNVANALAAHAVGRALEIPEKKILAALSSYRGAWRRFDYQGTFAGAKVIADYAHHPTEIKATLQAAREKFPQRRIWCVFQPHHYERTRDLFREFTAAFANCDQLILLDIYEVAGREHARSQSAVSSQKLAQAIAKRGVPASYLKNAAALKSFLRQHLTKGDVLLMMGAGSIWEMTKKLMTNAKGRGTNASAGFRR